MRIRLARCALFALLLWTSPAWSQTAGWLFPTLANYSPTSADNGKILATDNVPGANITVALPTAASVGVGWQMGFSEGGGHGLFINAPGGVFIKAGQKTNTSLTVPSNTNYEYAVIQSDGVNFRLIAATYRTALFNGLNPPNSIGWTYLFGTGYGATFADNGNILSSALASGPVQITLPSTGTIPNGWKIDLSPSGANAITVVPNGVSGGTLTDPTGITQSSYNIPYGFATVSFDGGGFRIMYWNGVVAGNMVGAQTSDAGSFTAYTRPPSDGITAQQIFDWSICAAPCAGNPGAYVTDALRGVAVAVNGSKGLTNAITGYVVNQNPNTAPLGQAVGVGSYVISAVDNSSTWGFNTIVSDNQYQTVSTGVGRNLYNEFDLNVTSVHTGGSALVVGGTFLAQPSPGVSAYGIYTPSAPGTSPPSPGPPFPKWAIGYAMQNGCCQTGIDLGTLNYTPTSSDPSQIIAMIFRDASANPQIISMQAAFGSLFLGGSAAFGLAIADGSTNPNGLIVGAMTAGGTVNAQSQLLLWNYYDSTGTKQDYFMGADNTGTLLINGTTSGSFNNIKYFFNGGIFKMPNIASGTPAAYACFTASLQLIKSAAPCI